MNETNERFLKAVLERLPVERVVEIHLFPAIRQGQMESGIAVIAAEAPAELVAPDAEAAPPDAPDTSRDAARVTPSAPPPAPPHAERRTPPLTPYEGEHRLEVHTAIYRWTRKGPDRGKWEVDVKAEADAPLITVEAVVRGVQERLGDGVEPERISAADLRALISEPAWQSTP
jgi:hypothetical protein